MAINRNPARMTDSGVVRQRGVGEILAEEAGRAGIGLLAGAAGAALQPLVTNLSPEGSYGRQFVSPEVRQMKRQESESMAAQRVAPYYQAAQGTQQEGMKREGRTEVQQLREGGETLRLAMKLQGAENFEELKWRLDKARKTLGSRGYNPSTRKQAVLWKRYLDANAHALLKDGSYDPERAQVARAILLQLAAVDPGLAAGLEEAGSGEFKPLKRGVGMDAKVEEAGAERNAKAKAQEADIAAGSSNLDKKIDAARKEQEVGNQLKRDLAGAKREDAGLAAEQKSENARLERRVDRAQSNLKAASAAYRAAGSAKDDETAKKLIEKADALTKTANELMDGTGGGAPSPTSGPRGGSSSGSLSGKDMIQKSQGR